MSKKMLINSTGHEELRVAVVEDGRLEAFYVETATAEQTRGNIYKGIVANVEPSLQAAFIDYGRPKHGFLQIGDLRNDLWGEHKAPKRGLPPLQDVLKKGREFLVQVVKEETGNKGAALTTHLSIPGQYLVVTPGHQNAGVSRQIEDDSERQRIKKVLDSFDLSQGVGVIARTAAEGRSKRELTTNFKQLLRLWKDIQKRGGQAKPRTLIHKEEELAVRAVRDLFTSDLEEILVDDAEVAERLVRFVGLVTPRRKKIVKQYQQHRPIFAKYQLEEQILSIYQPRVNLPSGGSIVIAPTEALVAIDVNSGKSSKGKELEQTALRVNLEAAEETARQLRLRDLGGLVVIDFIDMRDRGNQRKVRKALADALKKDKAKTTVGRISRFGLLEMSRQRIRPAIDFGATRVCPVCQGRGLTRTPEALSREVLRTLELRLRGMNGGGVRARLYPETAHYLLNARRAELARLEANSGICLELEADGSLSPEDVKLDACPAPWPLPETPAENAVVPPQPPSETKAAEPQKAKPSRKRRSRSRPKKKEPAPASGASPKPAEAPKEAKKKAASEAKPGEPAAEAGAKPKAPKRRRRKRLSGAQRRARAKAKAKAEAQANGKAGPESS